MKKLLSSEDSGVNMPLGDPVIELMMTMFTSLMALALQIDNKSEEDKMQKATEAAVTKSIDLTSLLPSYRFVPSLFRVTSHSFKWTMVACSFPVSLQMQKSSRYSRPLATQR
jgi:hypothetical protein